MRRIALPSLLLAAALLGPAAAQAAPLRPAVLKAALAMRGGGVAVDPQRSTLDLGDRGAVFTETCGLAPEALKAELVGYLDGVFRQLGPVLDRIAVPPVESPAGEGARRAAEAALREFARDDAGTAELARLDAVWLQAGLRVAQWVRANAGRQPAVMTGQRTLEEVYKAARHHPLLADGPLLPLETDPDAEADPAGAIEFRLLPPLVGTDSRLRPVRNVAQWDALRGGMAEQALAPLNCRLWYRDRVIGGVQDYLEVRGLSVQPFRTPRDDDVAATGLQPAPQPAPRDHAGIAPERPRFADDGSFGGRVLLLPDPLVQTVFVETGAAGTASPWPALYLLLPSSDLAALRRTPAEYLCRTDAVWKPPAAGTPPLRAVRLRLDAMPGAALAFSRLYLTPRALALRLQRLGAIGYQAGIQFTEDDAAARLRRTTLVVEPRPDGQDRVAAAQEEGVAAALPPCADMPPAGDGDAAAPLPDPRGADLVEPPPLRRAAGGDPRHQLVFGVEQRAGKPLALGAAFSRVGLAAGDRFEVGIGYQREPTADIGYSSDFVGFGRLGRRLQLSARAYSAFDPERPFDPALVDERRTGADLRATVDLWRDHRGSFGQAELGLARSEVEQVGRPAPPQAVSLADLTLVVAHDEAGTSVSPHSEAVLTLAGGRSAGRGFGKAGLALAHHRFAGAFTRWDLRLHAAAVGAGAPVSEYVPFGGEDSVRGFRSEAALARSAWALQTEFWMPLPWTPASEPVARILRRNVALAAFVDVGGLSGSTTPLQGRQGGAGIGLRYAQGDALTLRLDIARPITAWGEVPADDRGVRVHFTVGTRRVL